jgi:hypothetical protein
LLASEIFETLDEARYLVDRWRLHYNHRRPQRARGKKNRRLSGNLASDAFAPAL